MIKITAIILTKNEEMMLADCIASVSFCDEILVVDNGSTDRTLEIAQYLKAKVLFSDKKSFAERRNFGLQKAKGAWVLYIDADERISPELAEQIKSIIQAKISMAAYKIRRKNFYFGNHEWPTIEMLERLFKRKLLKEWYGILHETAQVNGEIGMLDAYLLHYTHRDLTSMLQKTIEWSKMEAELRFASHHPKMTWWRFPRVMISAFFDSYIRQKGWKIGVVGVIESMYQSFSMFITYSRLWEMQQKKST